MNSNKGYNELISKMEATVKNELNSRVVELSAKGSEAFKARCAENYAKLSKLGSAQRINKLNAMVEACAKEFPARAKKGEAVKKVRGTRQNNDFLNSRKKAVLQMDKEGNVVARFESVQAAHREAKAVDGRQISDSSICYCCNGKKGFKTAGGYRWAYEENVPAAE